jgi:hypothetical protein
MSGFHKHPYNPYNPSAQWEKCGARDFLPHIIIYAVGICFYTPVQPSPDTVAPHLYLPWKGWNSPLVRLAAILTKSC